MRQVGSRLEAERGRKGNRGHGLIRLPSQNQSDRSLRTLRDQRSRPLLQMESRPQEEQSLPVITCYQRSKT